MVCSTGWDSRNVGRNPFGLKACAQTFWRTARPLCLLVGRYDTERRDLIVRCPMQPMAIAGSIFAGFFLGIFIFSHVGRWFITLRNTLPAHADEDGPKSTIARCLSIAIRSSGPW